METKQVNTSIGEISVTINKEDGSIPIIFLHGVYYDHHLWNFHVNRITTHTTIAIDMPLHGKSKGITKSDWTIEDCGIMLIDILDSIEIEKCYAIGHSWGSMTILRAASHHPERFAGVGLCNMPLKAGSLFARVQFGFQHTMLSFRKFYSRQVSNAMFGTEAKERDPEIVDYLEQTLSKLSNKEIRKTDKEVITNVNSGFPYLDKLTVPAITLKGKNDYVPTTENIEMMIVDGKHTSPLEQAEKVMELIMKVVKR
jgi:pimeloyl-ACP methyl ester carboxylesterase